MADPIATRDIYVSTGVCAHRAGESVPAANVKANGWEDYVAGPATKAAEKARASDA